MTPQIQSDDQITSSQKGPREFPRSETELTVMAERSGPRMDATESLAHALEPRTQILHGVTGSRQGEEKLKHQQLESDAGKQK